MFDQPLYLIGIPIAIFILIWLLSKDSVGYDARYSEEIAFKKQQIRKRRWLLVTRSLIIICIFVAIAAPTITNPYISQDDPRIIVLTDESTSMDIFAQQNFVEQLREQGQVREYVIAQENSSSIADVILSRLEPGGHVVLLSDGQHTGSNSLQSVASYAASIQATINYVNLSIANHDAAVQISAPDLVVENTETQITIEVSSTDNQPREVRTYLNDELLDTRSTNQEFVIETQLPQGNHELRAEITQEDYFAQNNQFYKTITATQQPEVLFVGSNTNQFQTFTEQLYRVQRQSRLPDNIEQYAAVILNDVSRTAIRENEDSLQSYLTQGGGLFVIGGENSYEFGGYQNTLLEALLPVRVGAGANTQTSASIAIAIDLSGSTLGGVQIIDGQYVQSGEQTQNIQKALAVDLVEQLNANNRVGALGFVYPQPREEECTGACVLSQIQPLGQNREELIDAISRVDITGGTAIAVGMQGALQMVERTSGSQTIILISDGVTGEQDRLQALNVARTLGSRGGKVYTVFVGNSQEGFSFMQELAQAGNGVVFNADRNNRLAVLFGEPEQQSEQDAYSVIAVDEYDYITQGIDSTATLFGYNQVIPKDSAHQLLTSNSGQPVLTKWNYGVGRVAALTAYSGDGLGTLLQLPDSKYLSRTINWAIGPLERLQNDLVYSPDAREGQDVLLLATGQRPDLSDVTFNRIDQNRYEARLEPQQPGMYTLQDISYAVNTNEEFDSLGISQELQQATQLTGGRAYQTGQIQEVLEHARTLAEIKEIDEEPLRWPFLLAALIILTLEIIVRRVVQLAKRS